MLTVIVVEKNDIPFFGMVWVLPFDLPLPGAQLCTVHKPYMENGKVVSDLTKTYSSVFSPGLGTMIGHTSIIHIAKEAISKVFKPRLIPFALRESVKHEISRLIAVGDRHTIENNLTSPLTES